MFIYQRVISDVSHGKIALHFQSRPWQVLCGGGGGLLAAAEAGAAGWMPWGPWGHGGWGMGGGDDLELSMGFSGVARNSTGSSQFRLHDSVLLFGGDVPIIQLLRIPL